MKKIIRDQLIEGPVIELETNTVYVGCTFICAREIWGRHVHLVSCGIQTPTLIHMRDCSFQYCLFAPKAEAERAPESPWSLPFDLALA